jgi:aspartate aminotransferase
VLWSLPMSIAPWSRATTRKERLLKFSQRIMPIKPSATLAVTGKAKLMKAQGIDVISFGAGEPDFETPDFIVEAMMVAVKNGATRYVSVAGIPPLREAVAAKFSELYGTPFVADEVLISVGGKHALYNLFQVLVDPGDEVIVPAPYWVSYPAQIQLASGIPVIVETDPGRGFQLDVDAVRARITDRTVGIVINSPSNPSGAMFNAETLNGIARLAEEHDIWIISDDLYS